MSATPAQTAERWSNGPRFRPGTQSPYDPRPVRTTYTTPVKSAAKPKKSEPPQYSLYKTKPHSSRPPSEVRPASPAYSTTSTVYSTPAPSPVRPVSVVRPSPQRRPIAGTHKSSVVPVGSPKSMPVRPRRRRTDVNVWPPQGTQYTIWTGDQFEVRPPPGPGRNELRTTSPLRPRSGVKVVKCVDLTDSSLNHYNNPHQPRYC